MENTSPNLLVIEPRKKPNRAIIWLHGLGSSGYEFKSIMLKLNLSLYENYIRFIFPNAPLIPMTINSGIQMRSWYDIKNINNIEYDVDHEGIEKSLLELDKIIRLQIDDNISAENIIIAGFSQGGVIAGLAGLTVEYRLSGIILLSTYLPNLNCLKTKFNIKNSRRSVFFIGHGESDPIIPLSIGEALKLQLADLGVKYEFYKYGMGHSICTEELRHISNFIKSCYS